MTADTLMPTFHDQIIAILPKLRIQALALTRNRAAAKKPRKTEAAFDLWLQKGLHDIFDTVAREPIPDELLRLIEEDRKR